MTVRPLAAASTTVGVALVTVSDVALTPVIVDLPLFAALVKPLAVICMPTTNPLVMNEPDARSYPVAVADRVVDPVVGAARIAVIVAWPYIAAYNPVAHSLCYYRTSAVMSPN